MFVRPHLKALVVVLCLLTGSIVVFSQATIEATTLFNVNVRSQATTDSAVVSQLPSGTAVIAQGRNAAGDWALVQSADGSVRGWVAMGLIQFERPIRIQEDLPLTDETAGQAVKPPANSAADPASAEQPSAPSPNAAPPPERTDYPAILLTNSIMNNVRAIWQRGREAGRQPNTLMKIGESNIAGTVFLCNLEWGNYFAGEYTQFQSTIDFFNQTGSFCRYNVSAERGFSTLALFDSTFAPAAACEPNETPLLCEVRRSQASFAFIYIGIGDMGFMTAGEFRNNLTRTVRYLSQQGVVPILATFSMSDGFNDGKPQAFNNVIRQVARSQRVPLLDVRAAVYEYNNRGTGADGYHLSAPNPAFTSFAGDQNIYGRTRYEFMAIQLLHDLLGRLNG